MKKFSQKKDQPGDNDDTNRSALFGRRNPKVGGAGPAPSKNPYADQGGSDPYAKDNQDGGYGRPPAYDGGQMDRFRQEKSPVPAGGYGGGRERDQQRGGYGGSGTYGGQGGYGGDRYGSDQPSERRGGYGGMARNNSRDTVSTDAGRDQLFGGAAQRHEQRQQRQQGGYGGGDYGNSSQQSGIGGDGGYGTYQDRELTAEEAEEEDIKATKDQIKFIKQQDVASTRNMLRIAQQAEETGRDTLARLGAQGERIHNTEKNLDLAANQNRIAEEKAKELKTLNRSMFAMHVSNPFTASKRREENNQRILETHQKEREQRDATRSAAYSSQARQEEFARGMSKAQGGPMGRSSAADRAKYQFEADSEDEEMENEIEDNLAVAHRAVGGLKHLATAMGSEVDAQNKHIQRIIGKTDRVDDQIALNRSRLDQIK